MAEIENPAAIFSEAGLKLFIEALLNNQKEAKLLGNVTHSISDIDGGGGDNNEVEALVEAYKEYKKDDPDKMDFIVADLTKHMSDYEIWDTAAIKEELSTHGYEYDLRGIGPLMRGVMNRNPNIEKVGRKEYRLRGKENE